MNTPPTERGVATSVALGALVAAVAAAALLRVAGSVAAVIAHVRQPTAGIFGSVDVLLNPAKPGVALGSPDLPAIAYWAVVGSMTTAILLTGIAARIVLRRRSIDRHGSGAVVDGLATRSDVRQSASAAALLRRAAHLRPSLTRPHPDQVGYRIGSAHGIDVWASVEDSILVLGPPRSGKGLHLVINTILDAPGPVVTTSTRPDNLTATLAVRSKRGKVAVFDPQHLTGATTGLRWSPIRGCDDPLTAMIRATGLAGATTSPLEASSRAASGKGRPASRSRLSCMPRPSTSGNPSTSTAGHSTPQPRKKPRPSSTPTRTPLPAGLTH